MSQIEHQEALAHRAIMEKLWTEPVMRAAASKLPRPQGATVLAAEARCGWAPVRWAQDLPEDTRVIALDPSRAMLDQARGRIDEDLSRRVFFVPQRVSHLSYADDVFSASMCVHGVVTVTQAKDALSELARVTLSGGRVLLAVPTVDAFPELDDMITEALLSHQLEDAVARIRGLKAQFLGPNNLMAMARHVGLTDVEMTRMEWSLAFDSGRELLLSPMLRETFFPHWIGVIRSSDREPVLRYVADAVDTYFHERTFNCTVDALIMVGTR